MFIVYIYCLYCLYFFIKILIYYYIIYIIIKAFFHCHKYTVSLDYMYCYYCLINSVTYLNANSGGFRHGRNGDIIIKIDEKSARCEI